MKPTYSGRRRLPLAVLLLAVVAAGCGKPAGRVTGKVTYRGVPLTSGVVVFFGQDEKPAAASTIRPDGTYSVDNAPVGSIKTGVDNPPPLGAPGGGSLIGPPNDPEVKAARAQAARFVPIPGKYKDPKQSGLVFEVKSGANTINIDLP